MRTFWALVLFFLMYMLFCYSFVITDEKDLNRCGWLFIVITVGMYFNSTLRSRSK